MEYSLQGGFSGSLASIQIYLLPTSHTPSTNAAYGDNSTFGVGGPVSSQTTNPALYGLTPSSGNALSAALTSKDVGIEISCNGKTNPFRRLYKVEDDSGVTTVANVMTA